MVLARPNPPACPERSEGGVGGQMGWGGWRLEAGGWRLEAGGWG